VKQVDFKKLEEKFYKLTCLHPLFSKSGPFSLSQISKINMVSCKKVSQTLKTVTGCKHINLEHDCMRNFFPWMEKNFYKTGAQKHPQHYTGSPSGTDGNWYSWPARQEHNP
jgi:hypothetical protein